jgi:hypothetical protein
MEPAWEELANVLREARLLLALPNNDFGWSPWPDAAPALAEVDGLIATLESGQLPPQMTIWVLFAPTGPIQDVSESSRWGSEFLALARRCDAAVQAVYNSPR